MDIPVKQSAFDASISEQIWDAKYRFKTAEGVPIDVTVEDTWMRIATALAAKEDDPKKWTGEFYKALEGFKFLPAGRIVAGAGTGRNVTLSNCFTMGTIPDSLSGIFDHLKEAALTMQQGGGIGYDFSTLRPKGSLVKGVDSDASGPLSFMDCWDAMCKTIMSAGARRGAMMATMRVDHPDIQDFIVAKQDPSRLRNFNMSVLITDSFMEAVREDDAYSLMFEDKVYSTVSARMIWNKIMQSTYDYAEPGVIFIDRVNQDHNLKYLETVVTTNPCGEKPMGPYASCLLGSINLARLVKDAFTSRSHINTTKLKALVKIAIRMMDNVVDVGGFPLQKQREKAQEDRQLGLGVTGLADALLMMGIVYGSDEAIGCVESLMSIITEAAYDASIELAREKGSFPTFDAEAFLEEGTFASRRPKTQKTLIREYGIRNALLISIAPTGTISLYAGNVSSGIEPIFAPDYTRKVLQKDGTKTEERVTDYAIQQWELLEPDEGKYPPALVTAQDLEPAAHVRMQAAVQKWVDSSISKTVNLPEDISFEDFKGVYQDAYDSGCKGCTTYRPNAVTGSILSVDSASKAGEPTDKTIVAGTMDDIPTPRPQALDGVTYKIKWPGSEHALYITISDMVDEHGIRRPFEIFINSKNMEHFSWTVALTRMISAVFRRGGDVKFVAEELKAVFDPRGGAWISGEYVPSILAAIGGVIENHLDTIGFLKDLEITDGELASVLEWERTSGPPPKSCSSCGGFNVVKEAGCDVCKSCGNSACG